MSAKQHYYRTTSFRSLKRNRHYTQSTLYKMEHLCIFLCLWNTFYIQHFEKTALSDYPFNTHGLQICRSNSLWLLAVGIPEVTTNRYHYKHSKKPSANICLPCRKNIYYLMMWMCVVPRLATMLLNDGQHIEQLQAYLKFVSDLSAVNHGLVK